MSRLYQRRRLRAARLADVLAYCQTPEQQREHRARSVLQAMPSRVRLAFLPFPTVREERDGVPKAS